MDTKNHENVALFLTAPDEMFKGARGQERLNQERTVTVSVGGILEDIGDSVLAELVIMGSEEESLAAMELWRQRFERTHVHSERTLRIAHGHAYADN